MNDPHAQQQQYTDHDMLVVMNTKMDRAIKDIADINNQFTGRVVFLEANKLDKVEYARDKVDLDEVFEDIEKRMRKLERYLYIAVGAFFVIELIFKLKN